MSYRDNSRQKRFSVFIGIILVASMLMSLLVPLLQNQNPQTQLPPTVVPTITPPPAITDLSTIVYDRTYLHPSGLFTVGMPSGWQATSSTSTVQEAQMTMRNDAQASVIEVRLFKPATPITDTTALGQVFTEDWLQSSWREYQSWDESRREIVGDSVQIDFTLNRGGQTYIARQSARPAEDGNWVYITRVVTPVNASDMLRYVLTETDKTIQRPALSADVPLDWGSYSDPVWQHLIRFPSSWQNVDGANGVPASFQGGEGVLRVDAVEGVTVASEEDASAYATSTRSGLTVENVTPVTQSGKEGFRVAYTLTTLEGETESGVMVLLNGENKLHVANLRLPTAGKVNLNDATAAAPYAETLKVLDSFALYSDQNISVSQ